MKVYSINANIYSNSCYTNDPKELGKYIEKLVEASPVKTIFVVRIMDMPEDIFNASPEFEGFKMNGETNGQAD